MGQHNAPEFNSPDAALAYLIGKKCMQREDYAEAIKQFELATELEPRSTDAWYWFGNANLAAGYLAEASGAYGRSLSLEPNNTRLKFEVGRGYIEMEDGIRANAIFSELYTSDPQNLDYVREYGISLTMSRLSEEGIKYLRRVLDETPDDIRARDFLAMALVESGRFEESLPELKLVSDLDPHNLRAIRNLGIACAATGQKEEALSYFRRGAAISPHDPLYLKLMGKLLTEMGRVDEARQALQQARNLERS